MDIITGLSVRNKVGDVSVSAGSLKPSGASSIDEVFTKLRTLFGESFEHDGFAEILIEFRILKRGQKEIILHSGKQYRYVVDAVQASPSQP